MKIITILGSPRKKGNTAAVLSMFEQLVKPQHTVERINITDYNVKGCRGCDLCQKVLDEPGCRQKDDALGIFDRLMAVDAIVYSSPVYGWSYTAQVKALIDRHYCLSKWQGGRVVKALLSGKRAALLVTCGGEAAENADLVYPMFDRQMECMGAEVRGKYCVANTTLPRELGAEARQVAVKMAEDLLR